MKYLCLLALVLSGCSTLKREAAVFSCKDGARCDYDTKIWEVRWEAQQEAIDDFRSCDALYVQKESESLADFYKRIPAKHPGQLCLILKKSAQRGTLFFPRDFTSIFGGTFEPEEQP
jgi:hypothetical protein